MKEYADQRRSARPSSIKVGDHVLVKQNKVKTFSSRFRPTHFVVTKVQGSLISARSGQSVVTRNSSLFKRVSPNMTVCSRNDDDEDDDDDIMKFRIHRGTTNEPSQLDLDIHDEKEGQPDF